MKKVSEMECENLFEFGEHFSSLNELETFPNSLLKEIEFELFDNFIHTEVAGDQTDDAVEFIQNIIENVKAEIDLFLIDSDKAIFLHILTKTFTVLLSVKADTPEKIIKIVRIAISTILKKWSEQN